MSSYRRNPIRRRYRRNPIGGKGDLRLTSLILPAVGIGAGALGAEIVMGYLPIPANFKTGVTRHLTKGVVGLAGGWALAKFVNRQLGELFAMGALTIAAHDAMRQMYTSVMPNAQLGGQGLYMRRMGYSNPGRQVRMNGAASDGFGGVGLYLRGKSSDGFANASAFG